MNLIFCQPIFTLFDPGSIYSYAFASFDPRLEILSKSLSMLLCVSNHVGVSLVVDQVRKACVVTIWEYDTGVDLILLDMLDFDVILGME